MKKGGLFDYFSSSPKTEGKKLEQKCKEEPKDVDKIDFNVTVADENVLIKKSRKRRRALLGDDSEVDMYKSLVEENQKSFNDTIGLSSPNRSECGLNSSLNESYKSTHLNERVGDEIRESQSSAIKNHNLENYLNSTKTFEEQRYPHNDFEFLKDGFRRDRDGRLHTHSDYDPTTLMLPRGFLNSKDITPAMRQWWKIKSENFDTVLFFKLGKFYETFHMDADIVVKELGLIYMRGKYAHAGFPETSFAVHSSALIEKGYKVGRVEQTERPAEAAMRVNTSGTKAPEEKLVRRDLCAIISPATRIFDSFDIEVPCAIIESKESIGFGLLLSIVEDLSNNSPGFTKIGVCALDCSTAKFKMSEFIDDRSFLKLRTMLSEYSIPVAEIITSKRSISDQTYSQVLKINKFAKKELISIPYSAERTIKELITGPYFQDPNSSTTDYLTQSSNLPPPLSGIINSSEALSNFQLAFAALGNCIFVLKRHLIDERVISAGNFTIYEPYENNSNRIENTLRLPSMDQRFMIIDHNAMRNLDVLTCSEGSNLKNSSILGLLNQCVTPFGSRQMTYLVCRPLYKTEDINERLDAVSELVDMGKGELYEVRQCLAKVPDLERLLFRLHASWNLHFSRNHPQNKAILFNETHFNRKKVGDLLETIDGFETAFNIFETLRKKDFKSSFLRSLLYTENDNETSNLKNLSEIIDFFSEFKNSFDVSKAKNDFVVIPREGFLPEYDSSLKKIKKIESKLDQYLSGLKKSLGYANIKYWGSGKLRYLIEVPASCTSIPSDFELKSQRKGFRRFSSAESEAMVEKLSKAEDKRDLALRDAFALLVKKLLVHKSELDIFLKKISMVDCILSLAHFSMGSITNGPLCRPILLDSEIPSISVKGSYHPCLSTINPDLVANDLTIGVSDDKKRTSLLITGPNMGGKSTLMRQIASVVIIAQIGCYVPSTYCQLTPFDKIFARLGASFDHPNLGKSTFYVELSETVSMVNNSTSRSLILLDELGRGTATHDGLAIASSVLKYITNKICCITLFSTHYHFLAKELAISSLLPIKMIFMKCLVDDTTTNEDSVSHITFLYKIGEGICPKSYGFHVAALAGIPQPIIFRGIQMAKKLERNSLVNELYQKSHLSNTLDVCKKLIKL